MFVSRSDVEIIMERICILCELGGLLVYAGRKTKKIYTQILTFDEDVLKRFIVFFS